MRSLHDQVVAVVNQAFPAGIPLAKKTRGRVASGGGGAESFAGEVFTIYNPHTDKDFQLTVGLNSDDVLTVEHNIAPDESFDADDLRVITERLRAAHSQPRDDVFFDLHKFMNRLTKAIGSKNGFNEKTPSERRRFYAYKAIGPGGSIVLVCDTDKQTVRAHYRSGPSKRDDKILEADFEHAQNYCATIEKAGEISRLWHLGAQVVIREYLAKVPTHAFRHQTQERPSYQYDFPFVDIVLKEFPDVCLLRVTHEGFKLWREGEYVTVTDVDQLETAPVTQEIEGHAQAMWRLGGGLLYTTGVFTQLPMLKMKFTPSKLRG